MISVTIKNRRAVAVPLTDVTTGAVGIPVHFRFSEDWDGLSKVAVFKTESTGPIEMAILLDQTTVPHEVLTTPYEILWIGIYGENAGGTVVIPTIWANAGAIQPGTESEAYDPAEPTPSWAAQVQAAAEEALEIATEIQTKADNGDFDGEDGADGQDGISPTAAVSVISGGHRVTFTYGDGQSVFFDVMDGSAGSQGPAGPQGPKGDQGAQGPRGYAGQNGATFLPHVDENGIISWTNDQGLENPADQYIGGPQGPSGADGADGADGVSPAVSIATITGGHSVTITDADHPTGQTFNVMDGQDGQDGQDGAQGPAGPGVAAGGTAGQFLKKSSGTDYATEWYSPTAGDFTYSSSGTYAAGTVGAELSGQKNTLNHKADVIYDTASGDIASFPDGADGLPVKDLTVGIEPVQDTSGGEPSPTHICPISGWTGCNISHSGADTSDPTVIPISWQSSAGTVYGGTLDVTSGVLTVDKGYANLGDLTWTKYDVAEGTLFRAPISGIKTISSASTVSDIICSNYSTTSTANRTNKTVTQPVSNASVDVLDNDYSDADVFKTAMSGVQLVYELATPQTYQLTPEEVTTLLGQNNIWADCGPSTVEYPADTKLYIQKINTPTDDDMIADANIASGKYFIVNNNLYLSTTTILAGDPIKPGTNCTLTNLAAALNAINS